MSPDDRLAAFLGDDREPTRPAFDALFVADVMQRVAQREFRVKLGTAAATAVAAGAVLWACAPVLNLAVQGLAPTLAPAAGLLAFVMAGTLLGGQILVRR